MGVETNMTMLMRYMNGPQIMSTIFCPKENLPGKAIAIRGWGYS